MTKKKTIQSVPLARLVEISDEAIKAIEKDIASAVFLYDYTMNSEFENEDDKNKAIGTALMKVEQSRDKLEMVKKLNKKYNDSLIKGESEYAVDLG